MLCLFKNVIDAHFQRIFDTECKYLIMVDGHDEAKCLWKKCGVPSKHEKDNRMTIGS